MKKILLIGGAGFIGSNLIYKFLQSKDNWEIHVLEPTFADTSRLQGLNIYIHKGALRNLDFVQSIILTKQISIVVHLVSTMIPSSTYEDYKQEFETVLFPTMHLIQLCSQKGIKFIYFSSGGTVYGDRKTTVPFLETDPKEPISYYGLSKQMIENSLMFEHRTAGLQYLILRPSNPFGHGQNLYGKQGLIAVSLGRILSNNSITVWGDGKAIRDYIYIDDLCEIFYLLIQKNIINEIINIGSGEGTSINDIIKIFQEITHNDIKVEYRESRKADVNNMILDITKLKNLLPEFQFTSLKKGISIFYKTEKRKLNNV